MHYDIPMSGKELPKEKSSEISDTEKLTCMNNKQFYRENK